jgi:hypothetical protein
VDAGTKRIKWIATEVEELCRKFPGFHSAFVELRQHNQNREIFHYTPKEIGVYSFVKNK